MIIMEIFGPILISTLAGLSTVIGSFIVFFKIKRIGEFISFCLSFSLSVMISISVIELIPNSSIEITNHFGYILGFVILLVVIVINSGFCKIVRQVFYCIYQPPDHNRYARWF